jgi:hypothetical protein
MEMKLRLAEELDEFTSGSGGSEDDITDADDCGEHNLQLAHAIAVVDPPLTDSQQAIRKLRKMKSPETTTTHYVIRKADLQVPADVLCSYDSKLLSDANVASLFSTTSHMIPLLQQARGERAYIVAMTTDQIADYPADVYGYLQVTPSVCEVLCSMCIGFGMIVRYPNDGVKNVALAWELAADGEDIVLRYMDNEDTSLLIVTDNVDDLVTFDIHFTKDDVVINEFVIMHASMSVGKYGRAVEINKGVITSALKRIFKPNKGALSRILVAIDEDVSELIGMEIEGPNLTGAGDAPPSSSRALGAHYKYRTDIRMGTMMASDATMNMKTTHPGYQTTDGWFNITPRRPMNEHLYYRAGKMHAKIRINIDDSIYNLIRSTYKEVHEELRQHNYKHAVESQKAIIQNSVPCLDDGYLTTNEDYLKNIATFIAENGNGGFTPEAVMRACYLTIYRYRVIFDMQALPNIRIPDDFQKDFESMHEYVAERKAEVNQNINDKVIDAVLEEEEVYGIQRSVLLKDWTLQCPINFVEDALARMIDSDTTELVWKSRRQEYAVVQKTNEHCRQEQRTTFMGRLFSSFLFSMCSGV